MEGLCIGKVRYEVAFRPRDSRPFVGRGCSGVRYIHNGEGTSKRCKGCSKGGDDLRFEII